MNITELQKSQAGMPQRAMPAFLSHKKVWALKIAKVHKDEDGQGVALQFEDEGFALRAFTSSQLEHKPVPAAGMYFVQYEDGYFSFSPADAFESGYSSVEELPLIEKISVAFGKAILTPTGVVKTVRITQETKWGIVGELYLTGPQAVSLANEIKKRV